MALTLIALIGMNAMAADTTRYVRYDDGASTSYGIVRGEEIHQLDGAPWAGGNDEPEMTVPASDVTCWHRPSRRK